MGLVPNYVMWVLRNEGRGPHHTQGCHTRNLGIGLRKLVVLTLNIHQTFNKAYKHVVFSLYPCLAPKANMVLFFLFFDLYQPHSHTYMQ